MSRQEAKKISYSLKETCAIISIYTPYDEPNKFANNPYIKRIFRMSFFDITKDEGEIKAPCKKDFEGLKSFVDWAVSNFELLIVHCDAGISRSAGTAMAIEDYLCVKNTIRGNNRYCPNYTVYDNVLKELGVDKTTMFGF